MKRSSKVKVIADSESMLFEQSRSKWNRMDRSTQGTGTHTDIVPTNKVVGHIISNFQSFCGLVQRKQINPNAKFCDRHVSTIDSGNLSKVVQSSINPTKVHPELDQSTVVLPPLAKYQLTNYSAVEFEAFDYIAES